MTMRDKIAAIFEDARHEGLDAHDAADAIIAALPGMVPELVWDGSDGCTAEGTGIKYAMCEMKPGMFAMTSPYHSMIDAPQSELQAEANAHHRAAVCKAMGLDP